jgi:uncharacterized membrane protein
MPNVFTIIGEAWSFYRKQPVLGQVVFWLLFLPMFLIETWAQIIPEDAESATVFWFLIGVIALAILIVWGSACVLVVGKRLINSRAGRSRTSFRTVRKQARKLIVPLILTDILFDCFTFFWSLLLIVPGIIYSARAMFYPVVVAAEGKTYRKALKRSKNVVKGHTLDALLHVLGIGFVIFFPIITISFASVIVITNPLFIFITIIVSNGITSIALMLYLLSIIILYRELKKL